MVIPETDKWSDAERGAWSGFGRQRIQRAIHPPVAHGHRVAAVHHEYQFLKQMPAKGVNPTGERVEAELPQQQMALGRDCAGEPVDAEMKSITVQRHVFVELIQKNHAARGWS